VTSARWIACHVLLDVESGKPSDVALEKRSRTLDPRDAALATEIVFGVLRRKAQLDWYIAQKARGPVDPEVRAALEIGLYQRIFLSRVPAHAAVSESVELVRALKKGSAAGLVNAILRRLPLRIVWPTRALRLSMPEWLLARWDKHYTPPVAERLAHAALTKPLPGMDPGSRAVAELVAAQPGDLILDLCAAPGNKSAVMLQAGARVTAADSSPRRLRNLLVDCPRVLLDARQPLPFKKEAFDRILVDAPCSGTGTLARNPEIKWRLTPQEIPRHAERQRQILIQALNVLKPGGTLVYATCSLEPEENLEVVEAVAPRRITKILERQPGREPGDGFWAAVLS